MASIVAVFWCRSTATLLLNGCNSTLFITHLLYPHILALPTHRCSSFCYPCICPISYLVLSWCQQPKVTAMIKISHYLTSFILTSYLYSLVSRPRINHKRLICLYNCIDLHMLACGTVFDQRPCDRSINFHDYWRFCIAFIVNCGSVTLYPELHRELKGESKISFICF